MPFTRTVVSLALIGLLAGAAALPAAAQEATSTPPAPPSPPARCGGLLCDMGVLNVTNARPIDDGLPCGFICRTFGGAPSASPPAAATPPVSAEAAPIEPAKPLRHRRRHPTNAHAEAPVETSEPSTGAASK